MAVICCWQVTPPVCCSHLSVRADVQSPQVCLLNCELLLSELYVGVPAKAAVTLFNQTLLPAHFQWMVCCTTKNNNHNLFVFNYLIVQVIQTKVKKCFTKSMAKKWMNNLLITACHFLHQDQLQGKQASLCSASFDPSSGSLGPNASAEVTVTFTSHTEVSTSCRAEAVTTTEALTPKREEAEVCSAVTDSYSQCFDIWCFILPQLELTEVAALCEVQGMDSYLVLGISVSKTKELSVTYSLPRVG